jgi:hypothetical protein
MPSSAPKQLSIGDLWAGSNGRRPETKWTTARQSTDSEARLCLERSA